MAKYLNKNAKRVQDKLDGITKGSQLVILHNTPKSNEYLRLRQILDNNSPEDDTINLKINHKHSISMSKFVLFYKSGFFKPQLNSKWNSDNITEFELSVDSTIENEIASYFKDEQFYINKDNFVQLASHATYLDLSSITDACKKYWSLDIKNHWNFVDFGFIIEAMSDPIFGHYTMELVCKGDEFLDFLKYYFWSLYEHEHTGHYTDWRGNRQRFKFKKMKNKISSFDFRKFIHVNNSADDSQLDELDEVSTAKFQNYVDSLMDSVFLNQEDFVSLCKMYKQRKRLVKHHELYTNVILLYLGKTYRETGFAESLGFFDKLVGYIPWEQLSLKEIKCFKIFARERKDVFKEIMYNIICPPPSTTS